MNNVKGKYKNSPFIPRDVGSYNFRATIIFDLIIISMVFPHLLDYNYLYPYVIFVGRKGGWFNNSLSRMRCRAMSKSYV